jgi:predicted nucleic acid-binding protein
MSRFVGADAGPLITLARLVRIELPRLLYGGAMVPVAVMDELCRFLLIDERGGRAIARHQGIPVAGTAGLLLNAKRNGQLEAVTPELERLSQNGYRLAPALVEEVRRLAGE